MKRKVLTKMNICLSSLLAMLGFSGCEFGRVEYGVPEPMYGVNYEEFYMTGNVSNDDEGPLEGIRIGVKNGEKTYANSRTDSNGNYYITSYTDVLPDSVTVIAEDYEGVYATDSTRVAYTQGMKVDVKLKKN